MTLRTTRTETRARGPLALAGGLVATGLVLAALALEPVPDPVGAALPSGVSEIGAEDGTSRSSAALAQRERVVGRVLPSIDADEIAADLISNLDAPGEPGTAAAWQTRYRASTLAELQAELPVVFGPEGVKFQRIGYLKALAEHGGEASRSGFLAAAAHVGDPDEPRSVSLGSFVLLQLERRLDEPGFRETLEQLAWDEQAGLGPRLRGRAVATLLRTAPAAEVGELHGRLYAELDPHVRASAAGALRQREPEVRRSLAGLFPEADLLGWTPPADAGREP